MSYAASNAIISFLAATSDLAFRVVLCSYVPDFLLPGYIVIAAVGAEKRVCDAVAVFILLALAVFALYDARAPRVRACPGCLLDVVPLAIRLENIRGAFRLLYRWPSPFALSYTIACIGAGFAWLMLAGYIRLPGDELWVEHVEQRCARRAGAGYYTALDDTAISKMQASYGTVLDAVKGVLGAGAAAVAL